MVLALLVVRGMHSAETYDIIPCRRLQEIGDTFKMSIPGFNAGARRWESAPSRSPPGAAKTASTAAWNLDAARFGHDQAATGVGTRPQAHRRAGRSGVSGHPAGPFLVELQRHRRAGRRELLQLVQQEAFGFSLLIAQLTPCWVPITSKGPAARW